MRRAILLSLTALGTVTSGLAVSGTWAVFSDAAPSQQIVLETGEIAEGDADLIKVARGPADMTECPNSTVDYVDSYESEPTTVLGYNGDGLLSGTQYQEELVYSTCVRNIRNVPVTLSLSTEILYNNDFACSSLEESGAGDSCGLAPDGSQNLGELGDAYTLGVTNGQIYETATSCTDADVATIAALASSQPFNCNGSTLVLGPGETFQFKLAIAYDPGYGGRSAETMAYDAQSDELIFRYLIIAAATS